MLSARIDVRFAAMWQAAGQARLPPFSRKYLTESFYPGLETCTSYQLSTFSAKHKKDVFL
jgi:hypothetical protein